MSNEKKNEKLYKKWWFWVILMIIIAIICITSVIILGFFLINPDKRLSEFAKDLQNYHEDTKVYQSAGKNTILVECYFNKKEEATQNAEEIGKIIGKHLEYLSIYSEVKMNIITDDGMKETLVVDIPTGKIEEEKAETWILEDSDSYIEEKKKIAELETDITSLESKKESLNKEIEDLNQEVIRIKGTPKTYPAGHLITGVDVPVGKYKIYGGNSNFVVRSSSGNLKVNIILGSSYGVNEYIYTFEQGEKIEANSSFSLVEIE